MITTQSNNKNIVNNILYKRAVKPWSDFYIACNTPTKMKFNSKFSNLYNRAHNPAH